MRELKLIAFDREDLAVVSAQLQDAVLRVGEMAYQPDAHRFAAIVNRFNWLQAVSSHTGGGGSQRFERRQFERRQSALRFERVLRAQITGIDLTEKRRVLSLLAVTFEPRTSDEPDGWVTLTFSGGGAVRLEVECIECELRDLGAAWATRARPEHEAAEPGPGGAAVGPAHGPARTDGDSER